MSKVVIAPVRVSVVVDCKPDEAFRIFTEQIATWWPRETHSVAADTFKGRVRAETVVFEGKLGGRIYERMEDGREADWGAVQAWEPPHRVVFSWKPNLNPVPPTEVEVTFIQEGSRTRVALEHRGWERLGDDGVAKRKGYETGWPDVLQRFANLANSSAS